MNIRHAIASVALAAAVLAAAPATATDRAGVRALAEHSGLSEAQVRMVLRGRTAIHHRFPLYFDRTEQRLIDAIGKDDFRRLTSGESIVLHMRRPADAPVRVADTGPR